MRYLKNAGFLEPYIESSRGIIPLNKIKKIVAFRVPLSREAQTDGLCYKWSSSHYSISLNLWCKNNAKTRHLPRMWADVLYCLAHELAHVIAWEHTPRHYLVMSKIMQKMARVAKDQGIEDLYTRVPIGD